MLPFALALCLAAEPPVTIVSAPTTVSQWGRFEAVLDLGRAYDQPFDPAVVAADAHFQAPSGEVTVRPAFWLVPYRNARPDQTVVTNAGRERWEPAGDGRWVVRFAPPTAGAWRWSVVVRDPQGERRSAAGQFTCTPSASPGSIRVSQRNPRAFAFADGSSFVPVGLCVAWARGATAQDHFGAYFADLAAAGANAVRVWQCHWAWLEWTAGGQPSYQDWAGIGRYSQRSCATWDAIVDLAEQHGQYLMVCLNNGVRENLAAEAGGSGYDRWPGNPYNRANGGPCERFEEFWTHPEARRRYQQKLRYVVARWGHSPHVWSWEFWNELGQESPASVAWHREMADYLHRIDATGRPVTTSSWVDHASANDETYRALDLAQLHYGSAAAIASLRKAVPERPVILGEGTDDERGLATHNSYWEGLFCGAAGPPLTWIDGPRSPFVRHRRYGELAALARFTRAEPFATTPFEPRLLAPTRSGPVPAGEPRYAPVVVRPEFDPWLVKAPRDQFLVPATGEVDVAAMTTRLYGTRPDRAQAAASPTFDATWPAAAELAVQFDEVSGPVGVEVWVDDQRVVARELPGTGRRRLAGEDAWVRAPVAAGRHRVRVLNTGSDWAVVRSFVFGGYRDRASHPDALVRALHTPRRVLLWAENLGRRPELLDLGWEPRPVRDATVILGDLQPGRWQVAWWDTSTGQPTSSAALTCRDGSLALPLPPLAGDLAAKLWWLGG